MVWSTEKMVKNTTYLFQWQTTTKYRSCWLHASIHMILHKVLQVISPFNWNCHSKWLHRQQKILGWELSHSWECKPISSQQEADLQKTRIRHDVWVFSTSWWTATNPGSTSSRLCLGNKVIRTTEQFSTLRVWCPIHRTVQYIESMVSHTQNSSVHWEYGVPYTEP